jgi:type VI secretion system secreted protein VgrG
VRFHWDQSDPPQDGSDSCWLRVSQGAAGEGYGMVNVPRRGHEVIVDFLQGDPDRPIIVGRVYNGERPHPLQKVTPNDERTHSVWRTRTVGEIGDYEDAENADQTKPPGGAGGGEGSGEKEDSRGYNEIRMEDDGGQEQIAIRAQRNMSTEVLFDDDQKVRHDRTIRVGRDRTTNIKRNETVTVEEGDETHTVDKGKRVTTIQQNDELTIREGDQKTTVSQGDVSFTVTTGKRVSTIKANEELTVQEGDQKTTVSQGSVTETVSTGNKSIALSMGNMDTKLDLGNYSLKAEAGDITLEAMGSITLKVGANSVVINQMGVTIKGVMVTSEAQTTQQVKGAMTTVQGEAMTTVKGALVMIN